MSDVIQVYRRIIAASAAGRGIRLSREEVLAVCQDHAVQQAVESADYEDGVRDGRITCFFCGRGLTGMLEHVRCSVTGGLCVSMKERVRRERE
jgi:hypothetical protein